VSVVVPGARPGVVGVTGGVTTTVFPPGAVVPGAVLPEVPPVPAVARGGTPPSGRTHVTSRFEQKSGMVVRSLEASAAEARGVAATTASVAATASNMIFRVFIESSWANRDCSSLAPVCRCKQRADSRTRD
jgi:hypothetical protein